MFVLTKETPDGDWSIVTSGEEGLVMAYFTRFTQNFPDGNLYEVRVGELNVLYATNK